MEGVGFKSPRPPVPRKSRSRSRAPSLSLSASQQNNGAAAAAAEDGENGQVLMAQGLLQRLEGLLVAKSNEIVLAGRLGESLLAQQAELEARIRDLENELQHGDGDDDNEPAAIRRTRSAYVDSSDDERASNGAAGLIAQETRDKLEALESELQRWERGNGEIYKEVGLSSGTGSELVHQASQSSNVGRIRMRVDGRATADIAIHERAPGRSLVNASSASTDIFCLCRSALACRCDPGLAFDVTQAAQCATSRKRYRVRDRDWTISARRSTASSSPSFRA